MIFGYMSERSKILFILLLPFLLCLTGISMFIKFIKNNILLVILPDSIISLTSCNVIGRSIMSDGGGIQKSEFIRHLKRSCTEHNGHGYNISDFENVAIKDKVNIRTSEELDNFIEGYNTKGKQSSEIKEIFWGNLYHAIVDNYTDDYIVITAIYTFSFQFDYYLDFSMHKEYLVNEYLYKYFNSVKPEKGNYDINICNILAESVYTLSGHYLQNFEFQTTIDLIAFVLNNRENVLDKELNERLNIRHGNALSGKKELNYLENIIQETLKQQLKTDSDFKLYISDLAQFIHRENNLIMDYQNLGHELKGQGDFTGAIETYSKIIDLNPDRLEKYVTCQELYKNDSLSPAMYDYNSAVKRYQHCMTKEHYASVYLNIGVVRSLSEDYDGAIEDYSMSIEIKADYTHSYLYRGELHYRQGELSKAMDDFNKTLELNPELAKGYFNRALVYSAKGTFEGAIADLNKAIEIDPKQTDFYCNRGRAYLNQGYLEEAVDDFKKAIELNPDNVSANNNIAFLFASMKNGDKYINFPTALEYARKAVLLEKKWYFFNTLAAVYARGGMFEEAVHAETDALKLIGSKQEYNYDSATIVKLIENYKQKHSFIQFQESPSGGDK